MQVFIGVSILLLTALILGGIGFAAIWWFRRITSPKTPSSQEASSLTFPHTFAPALAVLLIGFHLGLYTFVTFFGPTLRAPAAGGLIFSFAIMLVWILLQKKRSFFVLSLLALTLISGLSIFFRANGFLQSLSSLLFLVVQVLLLVTLVYDRVPTAVGEWFNAIGRLVPLTIQQLTTIFWSLARPDQIRKTNFFGWLKTALLVFVVLLIFLGLLSQADPVFAEIVREFRSQLFGRTLWSIILIIGACAWWTLAVRAPAETETKAAWLSYRDITAVLSIAVVVIGTFLVVQFQYLFAGSTELLQKLDLTFSEYVRQGFTELLLAVLFGGSIAYLAGTRAKIWQGNQQLLVRVLNSLLLLQLGMLLFSAFQRNALYVSTYGLTRVRVMGDVFLIWMAFFLLLLLAYNWQKIKEKTGLSLLWVGVLIVVFSINWINVDRMVIRGAPSHHEYTDYFYLMQLSEDGAQDWLMLLNNIERDTAQLLAKSSLNDAEKAQLAGLKLATLTFIEKRDQLFLKYASDAWLREHAGQVGLQLTPKDATLSQWFIQPTIIDTLFPSATMQSERSTESIVDFPDSLKKFRSWTYWNYAEQQAYDRLVSQEEIVFSQPSQILEDILRYQVRQQLSLEKEEELLLHKLTYQFVNVQLRRYWGQRLSSLIVDNINDLPSFVVEEMQSLERLNDQPFEALAASTCATSGLQPITVYGVVMRRTALPNNQEATGTFFDMRSIRDQKNTPSAILVLPPDIAVSQKLEELTQTWQSQFVVARVTPTLLTSADPGVCNVVFTVSQMQVFQSPQ